MATAFERLIQDLNPGLTVMDVGYGGLGGENTTDFLRAKFTVIDGICKNEKAVIDYQMRTGARDDVTLGVYPEDMPHKKYDLLVLDPNIDTNLDFWSEQGIATARKYVNKGGYILTYIMTIDNYGNEATQKRLKEHRASWWTPDRKLPIVAQEREERRREIIWVLMRYE